MIRCTESASNCRISVSMFYVQCFMRKMYHFIIITSWSAINKHLIKKKKEKKENKRFGWNRVEINVVTWSLNFFCEAIECWIYWRSIFFVFILFCCSNRIRKLMVYLPVWTTERTGIGFVFDFSFHSFLSVPFACLFFRFQYSFVIMEHGTFWFEMICCWALFRRTTNKEPPKKIAFILVLITRNCLCIIVRLNFLRLLR